MTDSRIRTSVRRDGKTVVLRTTDEVLLRALVEDGDTAVRFYWVPGDYGYVHDVTDSPGTSGPQVCERLSRYGSTLRCSDASLRRVIRREADRARRARLRMEAR